MRIVALRLPRCEVRFGVHSGLPQYVDKKTILVVSAKNRNAHVLPTRAGLQIASYFVRLPRQHVVCRAHQWDWLPKLEKIFSLLWLVSGRWARCLGLTAFRYQLCLGNRYEDRGQRSQERGLNLDGAFVEDMGAVSLLQPHLHGPIRSGRGAGIRGHQTGRDHGRQSVLGKVRTIHPRLLRDC